MQSLLLQYSGPIRITQYVILKFTPGMVESLLGRLWMNIIVGLFLAFRIVGLLVKFRILEWWSPLIGRIINLVNWNLLLC